MTRRPRPVRPWASAILATLLVSLGPGPARAAFVGSDGTDPAQRQRHRVAVAVVEVVAEHVDQARKQRGYVLHRHVDLKVLRHVYGPRPGPAGLTRIPYSPYVNSAWPLVRGSLKGKRFLMAWRHGMACGLGSTVSFGPRLQLPILVTGPADPWVAAIAAFLALVRPADPTLDRALLERAFQQRGHPRLALIADAALARRDPGHRQSPRRFLGLLALVDPSPRADARLGWAILADLQKLPAPRTSKAYAAWWGGRAQVPATLGFDAFRQRLVKRLAAIAVEPRAEVNLRRLTLQSLSQAPAFLAARRDLTDVRALQAVVKATRDGVVEVRRSALVALLALSRALGPAIPRQARRLRQAVRAGVLREADPKERAILRQQLGGLPRP